MKGRRERERREGEGEGEEREMREGEMRRMVIYFIHTHG